MSEEKMNGVQSDVSVKVKNHRRNGRNIPDSRSGVMLKTGLISLSYFLIELLAFLLLKPGDGMVLCFGVAWSFLLTAVVLSLPRTGGRIVYGITYYLAVLWTLAQCGYQQIFHRLMWLSDILYAGEGAGYLYVLLSFPLLWWIGGAALLILGGVAIGFWPIWTGRKGRFLYCGISGITAVAVLIALPHLLFARDREIWGTHSEYAQSSSYEARYTTMYDARSVYDICGVYQLSFRDIWKHAIYPITPGYRQEMEENRAKINEYFDQRSYAGENEMTGVLEGKNVVLVLMESMDDWLITQEDTPTLCRLMDEGINFKNFFTPFYGTARTLNTEFCSNTGIFLPTNGNYVFDYITNDFNESMANRLTANGYTAEVFHYNDPSFYSRGVMEPAVGYHQYNSYVNYVSEKEQLYDECYLFNSQPLNDLFFRDGPTFNFIITRSAHLSYKYNEVLSYRALKQYPEYRGKYGHEEIDCARVKAKLVDDLFARMIQELEANGQLENTVIIGITDHYTYGFEDKKTLYSLSGVMENDLMLEKTPCFIWSADGPDLEVEKTVNTSDLLPTVLNLMGIESPYHYLGRDAFDASYEGYALFPDGRWISDGVFCVPGHKKNEFEIIKNEKNKDISEEYLQEMALKVRKYADISNLLLATDYYSEPQ